MIVDEIGCVSRLCACACIRVLGLLFTQISNYQKTACDDDAGKPTLSQAFSITHAHLHFMSDRCL